MTSKIPALKNLRVSASLRETAFYSIGNGASLQIFAERRGDAE